MKKMRIYIKYFLVIFILIWMIGVFYMFLANDNSSSINNKNNQINDQNADNTNDKRSDDLLEKNLKLSSELRKAEREIDKLREINRKNEMMLVKLR